MQLLKAKAPLSTGSVCVPGKERRLGKTSTGIGKQPQKTRRNPLWISGTGYLLNSYIINRDKLCTSCVNTSTPSLPVEMLTCTFFLQLKKTNQNTTTHPNNKKTPSHPQAPAIYMTQRTGTVNSKNRQGKEETEEGRQAQKTKRFSFHFSNHCTSGESGLMLKGL